MDSYKGEGAEKSSQSVSVARALGALLRDPKQFVVRWNGKAAVLSAIFRGIVFLLASIHSYHAGRLHAVVSEAIFGAAFAGLFGTITQELRFAEPQWLAGLLLAGVIPFLFQTGDFLFHAALGTQTFHAGMIASVIATVLSAAFNLYIMRRGTLLVGEEGRSFASDLSALPKLIVLFVATGAVQAWRLLVAVGRGFSGDASDGVSSSGA